MASVNENIYNRIVQHQIGLIRYSSVTVKEMIALLNRSQVRVLDQISAFDVDEGNGTFSQARLQALLDAIRAIDAEAATVLAATLDDSVSSLSSVEAGWVERMMNGQLPDILPAQMNIASPSVEQLYAAVHSRPFEGAILSEYYSSLPNTIMEPVKRTLMQGFVEGRTTAQIIRDLRGTRANQYTDGILQQPRRSIEKLVRTALNHTANTAREEVYKNNEDVIGSIRWVSTLDMRTSPLCQSLDGQTFKPGEGPRPPAHWNCRSTTTPVTKSWKELGFDIEELPPGTRASMDGQVPADETYQTWLEKQPKEVQDEALGPTRAEMFRNGTPVDRFVQDGQTLTLDQLANVGIGEAVASTSGKIDEFAVDLFGDPSLLNKEYLNSQAIKAKDSQRDIAGFVTRESEFALNSYIGSGYRNINAYSRDPAAFKLDPRVAEDDFEEAKDFYEKLLTMMKPLEQNFTLYRGIRMRNLDEATKASINGLSAGDRFITSGLTSMSRAPEVSLGFFSGNGGDVLFEIHTKSGAKAIVTNPGESELIFPHGSELKINSVKQFEDPYNKGTYNLLIDADLITSSTKALSWDAIEEKAKVKSSTAQRFSDNFVGKIKKAK